MLFNVNHNEEQQLIDLTSKKNVGKQFFKKSFHYIKLKLTNKKKFFDINILIFRILIIRIKKL